MKKSNLIKMCKNLNIDFSKSDTSNILQCKINEKNEYDKLYNDELEKFKKSYIKQIVDNNDKIKKINICNSKNYFSLSYLLDDNISQSTCIKLGNILQDICKDIIIENSKLEYKHLVIDKHETDHLFIDNDSKNIYYAEIKSNLNLDTEKVVATIDKCIYLSNKLSIEYKDYKINNYLVNLRFLYNEQHLLKKYSYRKNEQYFPKIFGINEYTNELISKTFFDNLVSYRCFLNYTSKQL